MKPVPPAAPKLNDAGDYPVSAPMGRPGNFFATVLLFQFSHALFKDLTVRDHMALMGRPSGKLAPAGPRQKIILGFRCRYPLGFSLHPHLPSQLRPKKQQGGVLAALEVFSLAAEVKNTNPFLSRPFRRTIREEGFPEGPTVETAMAFGSKELL